GRDAFGKYSEGVTQSQPRVARPVPGYPGYVPSMIVNPEGVAQGVHETTWKRTSSGTPPRFARLCANQTQGFRLRRKPWALTVERLRRIAVERKGACATG